MIKKIIVLFLILTFFYSIITPFSAEALDSSNAAAVKGAWIGLGFGLGVVIVISVIESVIKKAISSKKPISSSDETDGQDQTNKTKPNPHDERLTPSGNVVVLKW